MAGTGTINAVAHNLPLPLTAFIGREKDIEAACSLLRHDSMRLVTLTGTGGTGKTRLGIQVARQLLPEFPDGVFFVSLASISEPLLVATSIAQTLGIKESSSGPLVDSLRAYLRNKHMLLILDNFEQVLDAAPLVADMLASAPNLKILVTSRTRLRLRGEHELPVPPLALPDTRHMPPLDFLTQYEAVRLFIERAEALRPDFTVDSSNAATVAEICARLDGLPLAIELAAARIKILSPQAILARLQNRLKLLTGGERDLPERHQTLRSAIEWSYDLLKEEEKTLFRRLSVFLGSRSLEAIEAVCGSTADDGLQTTENGAAVPCQIDVLNVIASLVDQNLLQQTAGPRGDIRFNMLETIQEFAREKLEESGEAEAIHRQHAEYFLALAERAETELRGPRQVEWLDQLEAEHDNFRAASRWSIDHGNSEIALALSASLLQFYKMHGHLTEGRAWLDEALAQVGTVERSNVATLRARALMASGTLAAAQGDYLPGRALLEESLKSFRQLGDKVSLAATLRNLGNEERHMGEYELSYAHLQEGLAIARELGDRSEVAVFLGDLGIVAQALGDEAARSYYEESLSIRREMKDKLGIAMTLVNLGEVARAEGDYDAAHEFYEESLPLAKELGNQWGVGMILHNLGHVAFHRYQYEEAYDLFAESLRIFYELKNKRDIAYCLAAIAGVFGVQRQPERAAMLFAAAHGLFNTISSHLDPADVIEFERNLAGTKAQLSQDAWDRAWARGERMTLGEAVACALEAPPALQSTGPLLTTRPFGTRPLDPYTTGPLGDHPSGLSERELDVLRLVATGLTDIEVAEQLTISPRTVQRHLSSIYSKLGVTTRTAAARMAVENNLV